MGPEEPSSAHRCTVVNATGDWLSSDCTRTTGLHSICQSKAGIGKYKKKLPGCM